MLADVPNAAQVSAAVEQACAAFGHLAALVNNAGYGSLGRINLHGEFAFYDEALKDSLRFDGDALFALQWEPPTGPLV